MVNIQQFFTKPSTSIITTIGIIDKAQLQIALVVDENGILKGTVTDGDIRRGLLKGVSLNDPVSLVMNSNPIVASQKLKKRELTDLMRQKQIRHIPVLDDSGRIISLELLDSKLAPQSYENQVVLMAGGMGQRLKPLTDEKPKALISVGGKPILETIISNFADEGFKNFYLAVNYKAQMIKDHFGDGSRLGVNIRYLEEEQYSGTAGALSLLPEKISKPIVVMNSDVLTKVNFQALINFHNEHRSAATMGVKEYDFQIPYGVVRTEQDQIVSLDEKPIQKFFVNAGIYVLSPEALEYVSAGSLMDMPELFSKVIQNKMKTSAYLIHEYWMDIGQISDLERAQGEFLGLFK